MFASNSLLSSTFDYYDFFTRHRHQDSKTVIRAAATLTSQGSSVTSSLSKSFKATRNYHRVFDPSICNTYTGKQFPITRATTSESYDDGVDVSDHVAVRENSDSNPAHASHQNSGSDKTDASDANEPDTSSESDSSDVHARANGAGRGGSGPRKTGWHALNPIWQVSYV